MIKLCFCSTGQDRTGQDRTGQDKTGQDRTERNRTGQDRTGQERTGQDRTGQNRTEQDRTGQDRNLTGQELNSLHMVVVGSAWKLRNIEPVRQIYVSCLFTWCRLLLGGGGVGVNHN